MRYPNLRIAGSGFWGLTCVLLFVLWVRGYWWRDSIGMPNGWACGSGNGEVFVGTCKPPYPFSIVRSRWFYERSETNPSEISPGAWGFDYYNVGGLKLVSLPHWFLVPISAVLA